MVLIENSPDVGDGKIGNDRNIGVEFGSAQGVDFARHDEFCQCQSLGESRVAVLQ